MMKTSEWINEASVQQWIGSLHTLDVWIIAQYVGIDNQQDHDKLAQILNSLRSR